MRADAANWALSRVRSNISLACFQARHRILFHAGGGLPDETMSPRSGQQAVSQQGTDSRT